LTRFENESLKLEYKVTFYKIFSIIIVEYREQSKSRQWPANE